MKICCERSGTMRKCLADSEITLDEFIFRQAEKVRKNRELVPLVDPEDFYARVEEFAGKRLGGERAKSVADAVRLGTVLTADHHGGIFCSQTFQSDLLYGEIINSLGNKTGMIPIMSGGQVELDNSTYARGICVQTTKSRKEKLPFFSSRPAAKTAYSAQAIDREMIGRFRTILRDSEFPENDKKEILELVKAVYESDEVLSAKAFEDQVTKIGAVLSEKLFGKNGPILVFLEAERLNVPLIAKEIRERKTPLAKFFSDERAVALMQEEKLSDGAPITDILFKTPDKKGRKVNLRLTADRKLVGTDWEGNELSFAADPDSISELLTEGKLIPGFFLIACVSFFERGITWMGGVFQTEYLPEWQRSFANLLEKLGMKDEALAVGKYDCSAYVCGPMFALYGNEDYANPAGPVEFWMKKPEYEQIRGMIRGTNIRDAHLIGLSEMYMDLTHPDERPDGWYETLGRELRKSFPGNVL
ncbi:MAG: hypothetical protein IKR27_04410 [Lachnospiraceae bacterium]|nr:hypothetical protein [Lachnospiraceae bacterium]